MTTITEGIALAHAAPTAHEFDAHGHAYQIMLPAHRSEATSAYYERILTDRIALGMINARATSGIIAGTYEWERVA